MESSYQCRTLPEKSDDNSTRLCSSALKTFENTHLHCKEEANEDNATADTEHLEIQQHNSNNQSEMKKMCAPITTTIEDKKLPLSIYVCSQHNSSEKETHEEDDGSVSSLDSVEVAQSKSSSNHQRSIFNSYWKHTIREEELSCSQTERISSCSFSSCQSPSLSHDATMSIPLHDEFAFQEFNRDFSKNCRTNTTCCDYEAILHHNERGRTSIPHAVLLRDATDIETLSKSTTNSTNTQSFRSLFKAKYSTSSPSLSYGYLDTQVPVRKTSSASSLRKKQRSCLRNRSMSVDSTIAPGSLQSSSSKSVSFDPKVFVHQYEKPHDRYTSNGWSKWFV